MSINQYQIFHSTKKKKWKSSPNLTRLELMFLSSSSKSDVNQGCPRRKWFLKMTPCLPLSSPSLIMVFFGGGGGRYNTPPKIVQKEWRRLGHADRCLRGPPRLYCHHFVECECLSVALWWRNYRQGKEDTRGKMANRPTWAGRHFFFGECRVKEVNKKRVYTIIRMSWILIIFAYV